MKKSSLAEIMGKGAANKAEGGLKLSHLGSVLGDALPDLPKNSLGRHRLIRALQQRFGDNFRALPGVKDVITEFDNDVKFQAKLREMRAIRPKGK